MYQEIDDDVDVDNSGGSYRIKKRLTRSEKRKAKEERILKNKFLTEVKPPVQAKTSIQREFLKSLNTHDVIVFNAPAGVGKSFLTMSVVSDWLKKGEVNKVVLTRPSIPMGRSIGLLPGDLREKYEQYLQPLLQVLWQRYGRNYYESCLNNGSLELLPAEYSRGRSIDGVFILDEAQSFHPDEVYTLLTRLEEGGKIIMIGDPNQSDIRGENGIAWLKGFVEKNPDLKEHIKIINATSDDIVRSGLCKALVKAKEREVTN